MGSAIQLSPGVVTREIDLTTIVPNVSVSIGALGGVFRWGAIDRRILIDSEFALMTRMGKPTNFNAETWFTGANFLSYTDQLLISRAANTTGASPITDATMTTGNATVIVTDTTILNVGMIAISSNNNTLKIGSKIASITNSTAFVLDATSDVLANSVSSLQFVHNAATYTAFANVAQVANLSAQIVKNPEDYAHKDGVFDTNIMYIAKYPGSIGNSLRISVCDTANGFESTVNLASYGNGGATIAMTIGANTANVVVIYGHTGNQTAAQTAVNTSIYSLRGQFALTDLIEFGNTDIGTQAIKLVAQSNVTVTSNSTVATANYIMTFEDQQKLIADQLLSANVTRYWQYFDLMDQPPGQSDYLLNFGNGAAQDELHVVVADEDGQFTGVPGTVLESYKGLSRATDAKTLDGATNYYKTVLNDKSQYIWFCHDRTTALSNTAINLTTASNNNIFSLPLSFGYDGSDEKTVSIGVLANAYDLFASSEDVDVNLIMQGKARGGTAGGMLANYITDNIVEKRQDCVLFASPDYFDVVNQRGFETDNIIAYRNTLRSTSYAMLDSGYKYTYDRYNDVYRYVPLNGDIAGLAARCDLTNDPWWSFAGFNRGLIKNVVRLPYNPRHADRDALYKNGINPVVTFPQNGTLLYGDKTLQAKPSAFDRINVRRLFIVLRKSISIAAKYSLFEFNDAFTRAQFKNLINPYLRDVKGRRGITDFIVVCDETNNTGEIIDRNEFVGDIYIKPARSISFITLNFVAVRTGISFSEVIGRF